MKWNKVVGLLLILLFAQQAFSYGQGRFYHMPEHDEKLYYFGLSFGANMAYYQIKPSEEFYLGDRYQQVQGKWGPGFSVGIMGHLRLNKFVDLRFIPGIVFSEKSIWLEDLHKDINEERNTESIYMRLPLSFKFKSDRINNFRFYGIAGGRFDYNLAANAKSRRADEWLKIKPLDVGVDFGFGLEFYFPNFIMAPEITFSQGLLNRKMHDPDIDLSFGIDQIKARMFTISINLKG